MVRCEFNSWDPREHCERKATGSIDGRALCRVHLHLIVDVRLGEQQSAQITPCKSDANA